MTEETQGQEVVRTGGPEVGEPTLLDVRKGMFHASQTGDTSGYGRMTWFVEMPAPSQQPYGGWFDEVADRLVELLPAPDEAISHVVVHRGEITFFVNRDHLVEVCRILRDDPFLRFELCRSISGVHYPTHTDNELHVVYQLLSMTHNRGIRLETTAPDAKPHVPSVVSVYPTADWHERETWDMFGVIFDGHPALTRILMPDDWPGHPQRKDYPLGGIPVEYKGATIAPVEERRNYNS